MNNHGYVQLLRITGLTRQNKNDRMTGFKRMSPLGYYLRGGQDRAMVEFYRVDPSPVTGEFYQMYGWQLQGDDRHGHSGCVFSLRGPCIHLQYRLARIRGGMQNIKRYHKQLVYIRTILLRISRSRSAFTSCIITSILSSAAWLAMIALSMRSAIWPFGAWTVFVSSTLWRTALT